MDLRAGAGAVSGRIRSLLAPLADVIYPPVCLACTRRLESAGELVCPECRAALRPVDAGHPAWQAVLGELRAGGAAADFLSCFLFEQEGALQELLHHLKYRGFRRVGGLLGRMLAGRVLEHPRYSTAHLIVPVPLHPRRLRERGFNQSELIARGISAAASIRVRPEALARIRWTRSQTELSLAARRRNVAGAFAAPPASLTGLRVILVDDVVTSGATLVAAAGALRAAGAAEVLAATLAVAG